MFKDQNSIRKDASMKMSLSLGNLREGFKIQADDLAAVNEYFDLIKTPVDASNRDKNASEPVAKDTFKRMLSETDSNENLPSFQLPIRRDENDEYEIDQLSQQTQSQLEISKQADSEDTSVKSKRQKTEDTEMLGFCNMCDGSVKWYVCI